MSSPKSSLKKLNFRSLRADRSLPLMSEDWQAILSLRFSPSNRAFLELLKATNNTGVAVLAIQGWRGLHMNSVQININQCLHKAGLTFSLLPVNCGWRGDSENPEAKGFYRVFKLK